ncbi:hypothetical protein [Phycisphaera mikurensis]|uniref:PEP-CTERM protein-sorting domain-containing protein n=1 Tax=Phycisphaera mikurensis (strain NBRC 102666 / KCTC 22515 / FYK2301M01) TaxID=1142394 RepID=I0ID27_PHYMF|nr:hypothetical protein [Phycisphaera mikurensis]MBB6442290.1 MYXO-CTERM domain-containing protein [Phycisphaera mikurensis]BAM03165.1 hypothetical protein PSMK_10060 [Phycisphaera mikurensis NBRC 102666]
MKKTIARPATALAAALTLAAGTAASAASVDLTSERPAFARGVDVRFDDGTSARVSATSTKWWNGRTKKAWVGQYRGGFGVSSWMLDDHRVESNWGTDTLWFDFSSAFQPTGVDLTYLSGSAPQTLRVLDGEGNGLGDLRFTANADGTAYVDLLGLNASAGDRFGLAAGDHCTSFKVRGLSGVSAVPTPSAAAAGLALLAAAGLRRRRRHAEAA